MTNQNKQPLFNRDERQVIFWILFIILIIIFITLFICIMGSIFSGPQSDLGYCLSKCPTDDNNFEDLECPRMCYDYLLLNKTSHTKTNMKGGYEMIR